ncbi:hypothetical protein [Motilibacter aurantiacus]|uniref:hypothetical protein n=1 Tax=Motilibacter aurantiacus TaxID=2714955 RepID=UPI00140D30BE|nr:hypothetical protein [Motilibacter aurantiacus]NHC46301.1 hypothetical protein [Motilibacter aurantiacus]
MSADDVARRMRAAMDSWSAQAAPGLAELLAADPAARAAGRSAHGPSGSARGHARTPGLPALDRQLAVFEGVQPIALRATTAVEYVAASWWVRAHRQAQAARLLLLEGFAAEAEVNTRDVVEHSIALETLAAFDARDEAARFLSGLAAGPMPPSLDVLPTASTGIGTAVPYLRRVARGERFERAPEAVDEEAIVPLLLEALTTCNATFDVFLAEPVLAALANSGPTGATGPTGPAGTTGTDVPTSGLPAGGPLGVPDPLPRGRTAPRPDAVPDTRLPERGDGSGRR